MVLPPPISTLFPYTTLFRSFAGNRTGLCVLGGARLLAEHRRHLLVLSGDLARDSPAPSGGDPIAGGTAPDRKSTRLNSSHRCISYAVFCLKKKKKNITKSQL